MRELCPMLWRQLSPTLFYCEGRGTISSTSLHTCKRRPQRKCFYLRPHPTRDSNTPDRQHGRPIKESGPITSTKCRCVLQIGVGRKKIGFYFVLLILRITTLLYCWGVANNINEMSLCTSIHLWDNISVVVQMFFLFWRKSSNNMEEMSLCTSNRFLGQRWN